MQLEKIILSVTRNEIETYKEDFAECNYGEIPTDQDFFERCAEIFMADHNDYLDEDLIEIKVVGE